MTGFNLEPALMTALALLPEYLAANEGVTLRGFNLKRQERGWLLVVSATKPQGLRVCAFFGAAEIEGCIEQLTYQATHKPGVRWSVDKYAK